MTEQLPRDLQDRLKQRVAGGSFQSEEQVLRAAMDALDQIEAEQLADWHDGNRQAIEQSRQGLSKPLDDKAILARMRERLAKEGIVD